jgi:hypothetical protein
MDMLARFFKNDQHSSKPMASRRNNTMPDPQWRLKGHAETAFWRWVSSWARAIRTPADMGYQNEGFLLPELRHRQHIVKASRPREGMLFEVPAVGLAEEREELRRTIAERCEVVAELVKESNPAVVWCHLNAEGDLLTKLIDGAVQVSGSESMEAKEEKLVAFSNGEIRVLVTKPKIGAWGLNWQHCSHMTFFPSHSYEQYYQAVRRCWRFGQTQPVMVDIVTTEGGARVLENLQRKSDQATAMFDALTAHMRDALHINRTDEYDKPVEVPAWAKS